MQLHNQFKLKYWYDSLHKIAKTTKVTNITEIKSEKHHQRGDITCKHWPNNIVHSIKMYSAY